MSTFSKFFKYPFAVDGDITAVPNLIQSDDTVSYQEGYGPDYALQIGVNPDALPIPRAQDNQIKNDITTAIQQYQLYGIPWYVTPLQNSVDGTTPVPVPYAPYSRCLYDDGAGFGPRAYENVNASNTSVPSISNVAQAGWIPLRARGISQFTFTSNGTFSVPPDVNRIYVSGCGGGGGGGGAGGVQVSSAYPGGYGGAAAGGGGGGIGSGVTVENVLAVVPGETLTVVIGAGGAGGAGGPAGANNGSNGGPGGQTTITGSFGTITFGAGLGGVASTTPSAASGVFIAPGGNGIAGGGIGAISFYGSDGVISGYGGHGASGAFGTGGSGGNSTGGGFAGAAGSPAALGFGSGGGGGGGGACVPAAPSAQAGGAGGNGAPGVMNITY